MPSSPALALDFDTLGIVMFAALWLLVAVALWEVVDAE